MKYIIASKIDYTLITKSIERSFLDVEKEISRISEDFERHAVEAQMGLDRINQIILERTSQFRENANSLSTTSMPVSGTVLETPKKVLEGPNSGSVVKHLLKYLVSKVIIDRIIVWGNAFWEWLKESWEVS